MIGIIGGYGDIGINAAYLLRQQLSDKLRIGGRNVNSVCKSIKEIFKNDEFQQIDVNDYNSVNKFIKGCRIILNCTGICNDIAQIAVEEGCSYVDVGFNKPVGIVNSKELNIIYGAGAIPGLSGILPRYLANSFDIVKDLDFYYAVLGVFTERAAKDYVEGLLSTENKSMAMWHKYKVVPYKHNTNEVYFPGKEIKMFPFFDEESKYVAEETNLENGKWYIAMGGECTLRVLEKAKYNYKRDMKKTINDLCAASHVDCAGKKKYAEFIIEIKGKKNNKDIVKTLILKYENPSELTGIIAATTVIAIIKNKLSKGLYPLGECRDMFAFMDVLANISKPLDYQIFDCEAYEIFKEVEGVI
jgi:DNA polymerase III delta prime subunit